MPINPAEAYEKISRLGSYIDHREQRERLLRSGLGLNVDRKADYAVMTGCNPLFSITAVKSVADLLEKLGTSYTFLSKEVCCGRPIVEGVFYQDSTGKEEQKKYRDFIRQSLEQNVKLAKEFGAKAIVNVCPGCNMTWNLYGKDLGIDIIYYTELLAKNLKGIKLPGEIDFYEGCHRLHKLEPVSLKKATTSAKELIKNVKGLKTSEISSTFCCRHVPEKIFEAGKTKTLVTPSQCCYSILMAKRPRGAKVKFLAEVLCEAAEDKS